MGAGFFLPVWTLWWREVVRFYRQRSRVLGALGSPLVFWLLIGSGFGTSFRAPFVVGETGYLEYFFPGTVILVLLFTSIFSTISIIEDRREGFLQGVLVAPIGRSGLVLGKILGGASLALFQGLIFLLVAPMLGIAIGFMRGLVLAGILFVIAFGLTGLGFLIAWRMDSTQGFHTIMNLGLMPMWLLSGAVFPASGAPFWLRWAIEVNPLTYGVAALRRGLYLGGPAPGADVPSMPLSLIVTALFCALTFAAALGTAHGWPSAGSAGERLR